MVFFHGFYQQDQYLPLLITCAETRQIVRPTLRPGNVHAAPSRLRASLGADDDLRHVVRRLRQAWPDATIPSRLRASVVRGDAGFGVPWMYEACESAAAALNLLVRLRRVVADPPMLTTSDDRSGDAVPVADPTVPVEALHGDERRRYHRYRRRRDPLGQGHITTWRMMLLKVACEVIQSTRRILLRLPAHWPFLPWFCRVCQGIDDRRRRAPVVQ